MVLGCDREIAARRLCLKHYKRFRTAERQKPSIAGGAFSELIRVGSLPKHRLDLGPCWEWQGALNEGGYGVLPAGKFGTRLAHRVAFMMHHGRVIEVDLMHHCDNPRCLRPSHVQEATHQQNMADRAIKGRAFAPRAGQAVCKNGHRLTPETTRKYTRPDGYVETKCLGCAREHAKKHAAERKAARHARGLYRRSMK